MKNQSTSSPPLLQFSERVSHIPKSFLREILKVTAQPDIISFAGGLPNPSSFPIDAIKQAAVKVLENDGSRALQYAPSEGYLPLREWIASRYQKKGVNVSVDEILITNGSQQGLDLIAKIFIDKGDTIVMERPTYLGAIQAFSAYQPNFVSVDLLDDGVETGALSSALQSNPKLFYAIPNFQNPTGISYSRNTREEVAAYINQSSTLLVEDDPYGDISFNDGDYSPIKKYVGHNGILLGSFSKVISPGMRMGWIVAHPQIIEKLLIAKQAADLHSNFLSQRIIYQYLLDNDFEQHVRKICMLYRNQKNHMVAMMERYLPEEIKFVNPNGGMFLWITLPSHISSQYLLDLAIRQNLVFVPGSVFYLDTKTNSTLRVNYSNSNFEDIEKGIRILGTLLIDLIKKDTYRKFSAMP